MGRGAEAWVGEAWPSPPGRGLGINKMVKRAPFSQSQPRGGSPGRVAAVVPNTGPGRFNNSARVTHQSHALNTRIPMLQMRNEEQGGLVTCLMPSDLMAKAGFDTGRLAPKSMRFFKILIVIKYV